MGLCPDAESWVVYIATFKLFSKEAFFPAALTGPHFDVKCPDKLNINSMKSYEM